MKNCTVCHQPSTYLQSKPIPGERICLACKNKIYNMESGKIEKIFFKRTDSIPASRGVGNVSERTADCIKELSAMNVGDIVHIPITEVVKESLRRITQQQYVGSLDTAKKHLLPRKFVVSRRGFDVFIERRA